eukprot:SAG31_NODE_54_length_29987_cov_4.570664_2_plen_49_part_00
MIGAAKVVQPPEAMVVTAGRTKATVVGIKLYPGTCKCCDDNWFSFNVL